MAKKVVLGQRPDKIVHVVEFPLPTGEAGAVECHFRYRTREEFGALLKSEIERWGTLVKAKGIKLD